MRAFRGTMRARFGGWRGLIKKAEYSAFLILKRCECVILPIERVARCSCRSGSDVGKSHQWDVATQSRSH